MYHLGNYNEKNIVRMKNSYSWRDGWAVTQTNKKTKSIETEPVERCVCGSWKIKEQSCQVCLKLERK